MQQHTYSEPRLAQNTPQHQGHAASAFRPEPIGWGFKSMKKWGKGKMDKMTVKNAKLSYKKRNARKQKKKLADGKKKADLAAKQVYVDDVNKLRKGVESAERDVSKHFTLLEGMPAKLIKIRRLYKKIRGMNNTDDLEVQVEVEALWENIRFLVIKYNNEVEKIISTTGPAAARHLYKLLIKERARLQNMRPGAPAPCPKGIGKHSYCHNEDVCQYTENAGCDEAREMATRAMDAAKNTMTTWNDEMADINLQYIEENKNRTRITTVDTKPLEAL
jgi:hypothetical protein